MRYEEVADLVCSECGTRGPHELLYLHDKLIAHRCEHCGSTRTYSHRLYTDYAFDLGARSARLPGKLAGEAVSTPRALLTAPLRAVRKPFRLMDEVRRLSSFAAGAGRPTRPGGRERDEP